MQSSDSQPSSSSSAPASAVAPIPPPPRRRTLRRKLLLFALILLAELALALGLTEGALRLAGFRYHLYPERVKFGSLTLFAPTQPDPSRLWVPVGYFDRLRQAGQCDVVFMGCSCTQFGDYDRHLARLAAERRDGRSFSYINLGCLGWTSFQGLQQFRRDVIALHPKIVTVFYGWNDHWIGFGIEDKQVYAMNHSLLNRMRGSRLVQLIQKVWAWATGFRRQEFPQRVPLADFKANLAEMARLARRNNIRLVLLTAPSAHERGKEPSYLTNGWVRNLADVVPLHESYAAAVREVAAKEGVILCDVEAEFDHRYPRAEAGPKFFGNDGIHLKTEGNKLIAEILFDCFEKHSLLNPLLRPKEETHHFPGAEVPYK